MLNAVICKKTPGFGAEPQANKYYINTVYLIIILIIFFFMFLTYLKSIYYKDFYFYFRDKLDKISRIKGTNWIK